MRRVYFHHRFGAQSSCPWVVLPPTINHQCQKQYTQHNMLLSFTFYLHQHQSTLHQCMATCFEYLDAKKKNTLKHTTINKVLIVYCQSYCILEGHYNSKQFLKNVSVVNLPTTLNVYYVLVSLHSGFCASLFIIK